MTVLTAQQRRKLNRYLSHKRCPTCRDTLRLWASAQGVVLCPVCGSTRTLNDLRLQWVSTGRYSYWTTITGDQK